MSDITENISTKYLEVPGIQIKVIPNKPKFDIAKFATEKIGVVYFISDNNKVKIGITGSIFTLPHRFRVLQGCNANRIYLMGIIQDKDYKRLEKQLHSQFSKYNDHSEWFLLSDEIKVYIENHTTKIELPNTIYGETYLSMEEIY